VEGCTGWRFVVEELTAGRGARPSGRSGGDRRLAGPQESAPRTDAPMPGCYRPLLWEGRLPESAIPPPLVLEVRTLSRLYCALMDERRAWQQRIQAQLFHQGCPAITALRSTGRPHQCGRRRAVGGGPPNAWMLRCGASMNSPSKSSHYEHN